MSHSFHEVHRSWLEPVLMGGCLCLTRVVCIVPQAMKCADVSSGAKPFRIHEKWTMRIAEEFYRQGDEEKRAGLSVADFMDRHKVNLPKSQQGFIKFVVQPIFSAWFELFPAVMPCLSYIDDNLQVWKGMEQGHIEMPEYLRPLPPTTQPLKVATVPPTNLARDAKPGLNPSLRCTICISCTGAAPGLLLVRPGTAHPL